MKITREELTRLLAEKVMTGYRWGMINGKHYLYSFETGETTQKFEPLEDANHALQVLEEWIRQGRYDQHRVYTIVARTDHSPCIRLLEARNEVAGSINPNLNHAICLAVAEAVNGNKYELED